MPKERKSEIDDANIKIAHIMADGTNRDSIKGYKVPYNDKTAIAYRLLAKWAYETQE